VGSVVVIYAGTNSNDQCAIDIPKNKFIVNTRKWGLDNYEENYDDDESSGGSDSEEDDGCAFAYDENRDTLEQGCAVDEDDIPLLQNNNSSDLADEVDNSKRQRTEDADAETNGTNREETDNSKTLKVSYSTHAFDGEEN